MKPTLEQVLDAALIAGVPRDKAEHFFYHYDPQGWLWGNGLPITNLQTALVRWKLKQYRFDDNKKSKTKLFPISGKTCGKQGCPMPAVYKTSGNYDNFYCWEHIPAKIKTELETQYYV